MLLTFRLDGQRYALGLGTVERVVQAVLLTPLAGAPASIRGVFSLHGTIVPVGDLRRRLGLAEREVALEDRIVVARTRQRLLGLLAEGDTEIASCAPEDIVKTETVVRGAEAIAGIARLESGLVLIHDPALFLSLEDQRVLDEALVHV